MNMAAKPEELRDTLTSILEVRKKVYANMRGEHGPAFLALERVGEQLDKAAGEVRGIIRDRLADEFLKGV
jgi:hypothetical protein